MVAVANINLDLFSMEIKKITGYHELTIGRWMVTQKVVKKEGEPLDLYLGLIDGIYDIDSENLPIAVADTHLTLPTT